MVIEYGLSMPKIISKRCEMVMWRHINRRDPVFFRYSEGSSKKTVLSLDWIC